MISRFACKNEENLVKNKGTREVTRLCQLFRRPRADNAAVSGEILPKFDLIQAFMHVLNTCKNEEDRVKNEGIRVATTFLPL